MLPRLLHLRGDNALRTAKLPMCSAHEPMKPQHKPSLQLVYKPLPLGPGKGQRASSWYKSHRAGGHGCSKKQCKTLPAREARLRQPSDLCADFKAANDHRRNAQAVPSTLTHASVTTSVSAGSCAEAKHEFQHDTEAAAGASSANGTPTIMALLTSNYACAPTRAWLLCAPRGVR